MPRKVKKGPSFATAGKRTAHLKPDKFRNYLTLGELARKVKKDPSWIRKLEAQGRIPEAVRHKLGKLEVRLYSPAACIEIESIFSGMRPGRPRKEH